ncbi:MAG: TolC family protein, partial [Pseudomonadota bacterium]|nr:TolC family protein [Pseudomonadota bacterium]
MDSNKMPVPAINPTMKPSSRLNFYPVTLGAAFLFLVCAFPVRASENTPINFNSALALALKSNPSQAGSLARIEEAAAALQTTNAIKRPHLNLEENAARSNNPLTVLGYHLTQQRATFSDFGLGSYSGPSTLDIVPAQLNHPGYAQNFDTGLVITLPLYSGGRNRALIHQAQAMLKAAKEGNIDARNLLTYDLLKAYAGVHTARSSLETAEHASTAAQNEVYSAHQLFRQGLVTQSDILLTESKLSQDQANVKRARSILNNEIDTFRTLLGKPSSHLIPGIPVTLQDP